MKERTSKETFIAEEDEKSRNGFFLSSRQKQNTNCLAHKVSVYDEREQKAKKVRVVQMQSKIQIGFLNNNKSIHWSVTRATRSARAHKTTMVSFGWFDYIIFIRASCSLVS